MGGDGVNGGDGGGGGRGGGGEGGVHDDSSKKNGVVLVITLVSRGVQGWSEGKVECSSALILPSNSLPVRLCGRTGYLLPTLADIESLVSYALLGSENR